MIARAAALCLLAAALPAAADEFDPATLDLPALVECRVDVPAYTSFAFWLAGEPDAPGKLGWRAIDSGNPFLSQYEMDKPLTVFGLETKTIVFTSSGPMAVLDGVSVSDLAKKLGIEPTLSTSQSSWAKRWSRKRRKLPRASLWPRASASTCPPSRHIPARCWRDVPTCLKSSRKLKPFFLSQPVRRGSTTPRHHTCRRDKPAWLLRRALKTDSG